MDEIARRRRNKGNMNIEMDEREKRMSKVNERQCKGRDVKRF